MRSIRHWAIELAVVVVGVLLALWTAEWAEGRREGRLQAQRVANMDHAIRDIAATAAAAKGSYECEDSRLADLKAGLDRHGLDWPGPPATSGPDLTANLIFPLPINVGTSPISLAPFEAAEANGTLGTLSAEESAYYQTRQREVGFMNDAHDMSVDAMIELAILSEPRRLSRQEWDDARQALATLELARLIRRTHESGILRQFQKDGEFDQAFWNTFDHFARLEEALNGECYAPVDPRDGSPWKGRD